MNNKKVIALLIIAFLVITNPGKKKFDDYLEANHFENDGGRIFNGFIFSIYKAQTPFYPILGYRNKTKHYYTAIAVLGNFITIQTN